MYDYGGSEMKFTKSGSAGKYVTLTCATRGACKIQNSAIRNSTVLWIQGSFITIDGFEITNTSGNNNLGIYISGDHVSITRNIVHGIEPDCGSAGGGGIVVATGAGSGDVIDSNLVYDIGWASPTCSGKNTVQGINFEPNAAATTATITNNIVYHTLGGWALQFSGGSIGTTGSVIANNLFFSNGNGGMIFWQNGGTIDYNTVVNNTILDSGSDQAKCGIYEYTGVTGTHNVYSNNNMFGNAGGDYCFTTGSQTAGISVNPSLGTTFVNWQADGSGDYHQKAGSPTINNGMSSTGAPKDDFDGNPRPQGAADDIGAYESPN
jgi:hypothetical protein